MSSNIKIQRICQHCGKGFTARTTVTQYCGDSCAKKAYKARIKATKIETSNQQTETIRRQPIERLKSKEFLTVNDTAALINCTRQTVYSLISRGVLPAVRLSERKTLIKRSAIDQLFELHPPPIPVIEQPSKSFNPDDYYTIREAQQMYNISEKALYELIKRNNIPKLRKGRFTLILKAAIDAVLNSGIS